MATTRAEMQAAAQTEGRERARREIKSRRGNQGVVLGKVGGFEISLDYSWFVIFFLILGTFTGVVFPAYIRGLDQRSYLIMGFVGALLFFGSLLFHELAHAYVARWKGIEVEGITLFVFGGMARTRTEPQSAGDEFLIAGVGPVASLLLGVAFYGLAWVADFQGWSAIVWGVCAHMSFLNFALAVFNMLPGFPLDGGRVLRSIVWSVTGDLRKATQVATMAGKWLGYLMIGLGVYSIVVTNQLVTGLWFLFIGWFIANAATTSYQQILLRHVLQGRVAADAMTPSPETVGPDLTLESLVKDLLMRRPYNSFPVTDEGIIIGMVTLQQVKKIPAEQWPTTRVADVMTPLIDTLIVSPDSPMNEVLERMSENETKRVIVAKEWELRGIISAGDIANWLDRAGLVA